MKFPRKRRSAAPVLALTSMLDVIFLLLCLFVTVSVFSQWESEISIQLPKASSADQPDRLPGEIIINLAKDGMMKVNGRCVERDELRDKLSRIAKFYPGQPVIIRADKDSRYESLMGVIDLCRSAEIWNFSLATDGDTEP